MRKSEKQIIGILAHVDAGKTTLAESMLYLSGKLRKAGRVDHGDAFLDTYELEKTRGITIFSKQAELPLDGLNVTLLDTPGHVDFSAEMERTLQVLDYAILIVSGADGVQGHVETLWRLLARYQVPVFLFVNKMDQDGTDKAALLEEIQERLSDSCLEFGAGKSAAAAGRGNAVQGAEAGVSSSELDEFYENLAMSDETAMEHYLETGELTQAEIRRLIRERKVFPCYFGSALKMEGVTEFMGGIASYTEQKEYPEEFGARVFKIARDEQGARLTYLKVTGGSLKVKTLLHDRNHEWEEKVDQIRIYSGNGYQIEQEAAAGTVCAVTGLTATCVGEGLGIEEGINLPVLEPVLIYQIVLPAECNVYSMLGKLRQLEEEEPLLRIVWQEASQEIHAQLMGEVQIEVLKVLIKKRFDVDVTFGAGTIVYKETLLAPSEGVGHFEPLRHYAEVHLLLEPLPAGSGLVFETDCSEDILDRNWQRLVLTHLEERAHRGVLTGSEITDLRITLINGRAHLKHTEGGDFRQATYRAVRHGLKLGKSRLLEPVYDYVLEIPSESVGRAMTDIQKRYGTVSVPTLSGEKAILTGQAPVATMQGYQTEVTAYSQGRGSLTCTMGGYAPCHNEEEVIEAIGYDSERDLEQPTGSVFCAHGAGFIVEWYDVERYMHLPGVLLSKSDRELSEEQVMSGKPQSAYAPGTYNEDELKEIFERTYGAVKQERRSWGKTVIRGKDEYGGAGGGRSSGDSSHSALSENRGTVAREHRQKEYLLVDGYNIIFSWDDLRELSEENIEAARRKLMDILCNYQGYRKMTLILVFDAYKVEGNPGSVQEYHNIHVVYTKEAETADQYIERTTKEIAGKQKHRVVVATSDGLEQVIILGQGAARMSARELREEIEAAENEIESHLAERKQTGKRYLFEEVPDEMARVLEEIRLGRQG